MVSLNLKNTFNNMDINDKKNKISDELLFIGELIKRLQNVNDLKEEFEIKNYDLKSNLNEEEFLTFIYEDIFEIQRQLLLMITKLQSIF